MCVVRFSGCQVIGIRHSEPQLAELKNLFLGELNDVNYEVLSLSGFEIIFHY
jgi:hypothetical protein